MKKFIITLLEKMGLIPYQDIANQPCYDKYGRFLGWFSRSMAVAVFLFCKDEDGEWCVLGSERGAEAADFQGYWNCFCGYLDFWETTKEAAVREVYEECGVEIEQDRLEFIGYEDSPNANRQNVTFRFASFIEDKTTKDFKFSHDGNEGLEVGEIKWIKLKDIDLYKWAFDHDKRIQEIFNAKFNRLES